MQHYSGNMKTMLLPTSQRKGKIIEIQSTDYATHIKFNNNRTETLD